MGSPTPRARGGRPVVIDAFTASHEIDMVRYRLELHAPIAARTVIAESNYTFTGAAKPLYMKLHLTHDEIRRYNIRLLFIQIPPQTLKRVRACSEGHYVENGTRRSCGHNEAFAIERLSRSVMNKALLEEIVALNDTLTQERVSGRDEHAANTANTAAPPSALFVYFSDVDELLDPVALRNNTARVPGCTGVRQRVFLYNENCFQRNVRWIRALIARGAWLAPVLRKYPEIELRMVHAGGKDLIK